MHGKTAKAALFDPEAKRQEVVDTFDSKAGEVLVVETGRGNGSIKDENNNWWGSMASGEVEAEQVLEMDVLNRWQ